MRFDAIVIGAGMSGLAAGIRLALAGKKVRVLERHSVWGGLNSFYKKGGYHFDTGLHALTNYVAPGYSGPRLPLQRVCRQLRIRMDSLALEPQRRSASVLGPLRLEFSNDLDVLRASIARNFPREVDGFDRLVAVLRGYPDATESDLGGSGREFLKSHLREPALVELLLAPLLFYGAATEHDLDLLSLRILFNSIYLEGFARPRRGVRQLLDALLERLEAAGGELVRRTGVTALVVRDGKVSSIRTDRGEELEADVVISSAGLVETQRLRTDLAEQTSRAFEARAGRLAFTETLWVLDRTPASLGFEDSVLFFAQGERLEWRRPDVPVDLGSGVICCPSNYLHAEPLEVPMVRATHLADHRFWESLGADDYRAEKERWIRASAEAVSKFLPGFSNHVKYVDGFTPMTITRYTGHVNGAIYGAPEKVRSGRTDLQNLFLCGTDQGLLGIVGAMLSGIAVANACVLGGAE